MVELIKAREETGTDPSGAVKKWTEMLTENTLRVSEVDKNYVNRGDIPLDLFFCIQIRMA